MKENKPKRLNLQLTAEIDDKLREIASKTKLKLVAIVSTGIEGEWGKINNKEK